MLHRQHKGVPSEGAPGRCGERMPTQGGCTCVAGGNGAVIRTELQ